MTYTIGDATKVPLCNIQFGFWAISDGNANFTNSMMSHGPVIDNTESNRISWMRLPFPIKVYAISLTTDKDDEAGVNFTFSVRKDTDATYNSSTFTGSSTGSEVYFNSIVELHHEYRIFGTAPTFAKNDSIGLMVSTNSDIQCEFSVKLWCYQI